MTHGHTATAELVYQYSDEWRYERFLSTVEQTAGISWIRAERAARATLETLGERIAPGEARELARDLPHELGAWLTAGFAGAGGGHEEAEGFGVDEFLRRVGEREGAGVETAEHHARAVFVALARLVRGEEITRLAGQLPHEYRSLIGEATRRRPDPGARELLAVEVFVKRVARRAALAPAEAHRASEAVLETLAERIAGGEADDLAEQLPEELRHALERGKSRTGGKAQRMSLDEFVARIAEREGASYEQALDHARAVLATLRETVTDNEFSDLLAELPRGYSQALI
jgi:uncharacterized protein (DUF2267 family)